MLTNIKFKLSIYLKNKMHIYSSTTVCIQSPTLPTPTPTWMSHRNVWMLTVHLCNHTNNRTRAQTHTHKHTNAHTHAHTHTVVGGKGNPLCVHFHSSYECVSDIQLTRFVRPRDFPLLINITGLTFKWSKVCWNEPS